MLFNVEKYKYFIEKNKVTEANKKLVRYRPWFFYLDKQQNVGNVMKKILVKIAVKVQRR